MRRILIFLIILFSFTYLYADINYIIDNFIRFDKWSEAERELLVFIKANPNNSYGYSVLSGVYNQLSKYDLAVSSIQNAIRYEQNSINKANYYYNLGLYYYNQSKFLESINAITESIKINPMIDAAYYLAGVLYYQKNDENAALDSWKKYVSITSNTPKKEQISRIIAMMEQKKEDERIKFENEKLAIEKQKQEEEERRRIAEEEKKKREDFIKSILSDIKSAETETKGFEEFKVKRDKDSTVLEEPDF